MNPCQDLRAVGQKDRGNQAWFKPIVAVTVDTLVKLVGSERRKRTVLVGQSSAIGVAVGTVGTTVAAEEARHRTARVGEVAPAAACRRAVTLKVIAIGKV